MESRIKSLEFSQMMVEIMKNDNVIPKNIAILVLLLDAYLGAVEIHLQSVSLQYYYDLWNMLHDSQVFPKL